MVMAVLFGLAMDYEVFLVSSMREDYVRSRDARGSVISGARHSARVVTAAALIMVAVFVSFLFSHDPDIKPIALALGVGVLVDAFLVRMTLVPAVLTLLGDRAWWLPRWLDRILPNVDVEGGHLERPVPAARTAGHDDTDAGAPQAATAGHDVLA
jgi:RND superfamily putative drug exporter